MSFCNDRSSYFYKSRMCESIRSFRTTKKIWIFLYIIFFVLFFVALEQERSFAAYIPTGSFYTTLDILLPILVLFLVIRLQNKEYPTENEYGERPWHYRQPLRIRKILRFLASIIAVTAGTSLFYYSIGTLASKFTQNFTYHTYTVKVTSLFGRGHGGCKRSVKTDFLDQIKLNNPSIFVYLIKKTDMHKICMNYHTFDSMYKNKKITISTQESPIWGIYIKKIDTIVPKIKKIGTNKDYESIAKSYRHSNPLKFKEKIKENNITTKSTYSKKLIIYTPNK